MRSTSARAAATAAAAGAGVEEEEKDATDDETANGEIFWQVGIACALAFMLDARLSTSRMLVRAHRAIRTGRPAQVTPEKKPPAFV